MSGEEAERKGDRKVKNMSDWKHSQISDPEDIDALSDLLSMEIDRDVDELEKRLHSYWKKRDMV